MEWQTDIPCHIFIFCKVQVCSSCHRQVPLKIWIESQRDDIVPEVWSMPFATSCKRVFIVRGVRESM